MLNKRILFQLIGLLTAGLISINQTLRPQIALAISDPLEVPNNKFGIHIADTGDLSDVAGLINSSGGDWGYVTLVIQEIDRDFDKWQGIFNKMRRLHLIPLLRLATYSEGRSWARPDKTKISDWVTFLGALNWPVKNRYVILFNEPNHSLEWGNRLDPADYAEITLILAKQLKEASEDFFILPAGFDASAINTNSTMDEAIYLRQMIEKYPDWLTVIDGWTSHSYPNPGFSGPPQATGRGTLRTYEWELDYLKRLGLRRDLLVFITETGWAHNQGHQFYYLTPEKVGANLETAANLVWHDLRIAAVTPFVFNYQSYPFANFSWKVLGDSTFHPQYFTYQSLAKVKGQPVQESRFRLVERLLPPTLLADSSYIFTAGLENTGQSILELNEDNKLMFQEDGGQLQFVSDNLPQLEPGQIGQLKIRVLTPNSTGVHQVSISLKQGETLVPLETANVLIVKSSIIKPILPSGSENKGQFDLSGFAKLLSVKLESLWSLFSSS